MKIFLYTLLSCITLAANAQWTSTLHQQKRPATGQALQTKPFIAIGFGYQLTSPQAGFRRGMTPAYGFDGTASISVPGTGNRLVGGVYLGFGVYAAEGYGIRYQQGGNHIDTHIQYTSDLVQAGGQVQYLFSLQKRWQPYVSARLGYAALSSNFYIADPSDPLACRSLASETVLSDGTTVWGYGAGVRIAFSKGERPNNFLDISVHHAQGAPVRYVNVGKLMPQSQPMEIAEGAKPLQMEFINVTDGSIHQHNIAEVFRNRFNAVQIRVAYVWDILRRR